jgi:hypothetical protein
MMDLCSPFLVRMVRAVRIGVGSVHRGICSWKDTHVSWRRPGEFRAGALMYPRLRRTVGSSFSGCVKLAAALSSLFPVCTTGAQRRTSCKIQSYSPLHPATTVGVDGSILCHVRRLPSPASETLADELAAKLLLGRAIDGHTNHTSFLPEPPAMQASAQANEKRPAVPQNAISQKRRRFDEDLSVAGAVRLASRSSDATSRGDPRTKQVGPSRHTLRLGAGHRSVSSLPDEIVATIFDLTINSEFGNLLDELVQRNPDGYRPPVMPSVLSAVCKQWNSIVMSKPSMWRRISFSLSENEDLCDIPDGCSSRFKLSWQYRYIQRAKKLPLDVIIHRWSSTEAGYITNLFDSLFCVQLGTNGSQPSPSAKPTTFFRSILITSAEGSITTGAHAELWPLRYCAPDVALVGFGRQDWAALRPLLCSAQNLELYRCSTLPYQGCEVRAQHLFMEFTDDPCEEILPSHAVQNIIEYAPSLRSLAVRYSTTTTTAAAAGTTTGTATTTGTCAPQPRGLGDAFVHGALDTLLLSPHDLGTALGALALAHGLAVSAPAVARLALLELPPATPALAASWACFAGNIGAGTVARLDIDIIDMDTTIDIDTNTNTNTNIDTDTNINTGIGIGIADASWRTFLVPFVGATHLVVHPTARMPAVLRALLPAPVPVPVPVPAPLAPHDGSRRLLLPSVHHIALTRPDAAAFRALRDVVQDRLRLVKANTAGTTTTTTGTTTASVSAITRVDIYDYDSAAFSSAEWVELTRLLEEGRGYSRCEKWPTFEVVIFLMWTSLLRPRNCSSL